MTGRAGAPGPRRPARRRLGAWLDTSAARLGLSVLIIASLIPVQDAPLRRALDTGFLVVFGLEFATRLAYQLSEPRTRLGPWLLLLVDLVALLSFLPWTWALTQGRALRVLRLSRLVLLAGYWAPTVRDLGAIATRRERSRQLLVLAFAMVILTFTGAVILDAIADGAAYDFNADGSLDARDGGFGVRLWWAFRQLQDPGNMVSSPLYTAAVAVSLSLTIAGLFLFSFVIGLGSNVVAELVDLSRHRPPGLSGHTLIIGTPPSLRPLLDELFRAYGKMFATPKVVVLGTEDDRPAALEDPAFARVIYRPGSPHDPAVLARGDATRARRILLLAALDAPHPDAQTTALALAAREALEDRDPARDRPGLVVAEVAHTASRTAAQAACGPGGVVVPVERLLGLFMGAAIQRPGLETLLRVLMTSVGSELYTYLFGFPAAGDVGDLSGLRAQPFGPLFAAGLGPTPPPGRRSAPPTDRARVVPLGWVTSSHAPPQGAPRYELVLGSSEPQAAPGDAVGLVAVAHTCADMKAFAGAVQATAPGTTPSPTSAGAPASAASTPAPSGLRACPTGGPLRRVVVCGLRPATVTVCELLMAAHPQVEILVLVAGEPQRAAMRAALEDHRSLFDLAEPGDPEGWGTFSSDPSGRWTYRRRGTATDHGLLEIATADWTRVATFTDLPGTSGGHIGQADLVLVQGALDASRDGEVALAVLKLSELQAAQPERFGPSFRVVATVSDDGLAGRLERRYRQRRTSTAAPPTSNQGTLRVLSSGQLRGFFTFQASMVPLFERLYTRLLGPWSHSLMALEPHAPRAAAATDFASLAHRLLAEGRILIAWELASHASPDDAGSAAATELWVCPQPGEPGDWAEEGQLRRAWVVAQETDSAPSPRAD